MQPEHGNTKRLGSPINSARNLQRKLNRQERARRQAAAVELAESFARGLMGWFFRKAVQP